ncbi:MsnO8 family LLM class oxidoreductase [Mycoplasma sp. HU2014]|uniref:MsnO8 family LLM class oxidoreductase n=1 Tax=Mycoplasma sp. HU2014 TaxID=1664275 RepID=UPI00067AA669|nr:MsnO8 family LLM class oxidoreductase [Mycoplasma sp. HU2014]KNG79495.1 luciferase family protein [Mycoplasma sp. HU2014]
MKLSVLDHGLLTKKDNYKKAYDEVLELCKYAEKLNYLSFWVSEQHNINSLTISSPLILLNYLASHTKKIKLGSGGIMLNNYQPYVISEQINTLNLLHENRFLYGFGSAINFDSNLAKLLESQTDLDYKSKLLLVDKFVNNHNSIDLKVVPNIKQTIDIVMLITSQQSAEFAAKHGFKINYGWFLNPSIIYAKEVINTYISTYKKTWNKQPTDITISVNVVAGKTLKEVEQNQKVLAFYRTIKNINQFEVFPKNDDFNNHQFDDQSKKIFDKYYNSIFKVQNDQDILKIDQFCKELNVDHLMILPTLKSIDDRKLVLKRIAKFYNKRSLSNEKSN